MTIVTVYAAVDLETTFWADSKTTEERVIWLINMARREAEADQRHRTAAPTDWKLTGRYGRFGHVK